MAKFRLHALCVCGSGVVTSSMLLVRVQDIFDEEKIPCTVGTTSPYELERMLESSTVDLIITTTPLTEMRNIKCPVIHGHALLSGIGEESVVAEIRTVGHRLLEELQKAG